MNSKSQIIQAFNTEVLTGGDIEATGKFFHDDVVEEVPFPGQGPGLEGLKDVLRMMRSAFPDMAWTIEEQIEQNDTVVSRFVWTGTHEGEFLGAPATGRPVSVWGVVIDAFDGDKVRSTRILMDAVGLMTQLGAMPRG